PMRDFPDRLMGVTSVVWKRPRTATLVADNDPDGRPCQMLLIKRRLLVECLLFADRSRKEPSLLYREKLEDFFNHSLPQLLAQNRLFRSLLYVEEVQDWKLLVRKLSPLPDNRESLALRRVRECLRPSIMGWLDRLAETSLDDAAQYRLISALNDVLKKSDL